MVQIKLGGTVQHMPKLVPVHHVLAVKNGHAGKKLEAGSHKVIVFSDTDSRRVRVKSRQYRVAECSHCSNPPSNGHNVSTTNYSSYKCNFLAIFMLCFFIFILSCSLTTISPLVRESLVPLEWV
ncbi:hypothetical protein D3C81_1926130 [compost metagenome]